MSKARLIITAITVQGMSYRQVAKRYGVSKSWAHKLHQRFLLYGEAGLEEKPKTPHTSPTRTPDSVRQKVLTLREELTDAGFDAGAHTIAAHLARDQVHISVSTVWRILRTAHLITAQPQKRPRSSYQFFTAEQPNSLWQSDFTHWNTEDVSAEIIGWIDDHSRFLLHLSAHRRVTGGIVTATFSETTTKYGQPRSTLTDNGMVYSTRYAGRARGKGNPNAFETLLKIEGIIQRNGKPYKPTTQGKIERVWQTLKNFLDRQPAATTMAQLQEQLDTFRLYYNTIRPHRSLGRNTPETAYTLLPKDTPGGVEESIWKVRYDRVNQGNITLRHQGKLIHLGIGRAHDKTDVIALAQDNTVTVIDHHGTVLGDYDIDLSKNYQAKK
jgi:transposase InsO family protein